MSVEVPIVERVTVGNAHTDDVVYLFFTDEFVERNFEDFNDGMIRMTRAEATGLCGDIAAGLTRGKQP